MTSAQLLSLVPLLATCSHGSASTGTLVISVLTEPRSRFDVLPQEDVPDVILFQPQIVSVFTSRLRGFAPSPVTPYASAWEWRLVK